MKPRVKNILYATDLSDTAREAFAWAVSLAEKYDATITILHVMPDLIEEMSVLMGYDLESHFGAEELQTFGEEGRSAVMESIKNRIRSVCEDVRNEAGCSLDLENIVIRNGHPVREIIDTIQEGDFDVVVMGTHGHGLLDKILVGSVARGVVEKSPIPVLTVRLPS
ncbi:universal stress protein [Desulfolithobacter sp.]